MQCDPRLGRVSLVVCMYIPRAFLKKKNEIPPYLCHIYIYKGIYYPRELKGKRNERSRKYERMVKSLFEKKYEKDFTKSKKFIEDDDDKSRNIYIFADRTFRLDP